VLVELGVWVLSRVLWACRYVARLELLDNENKKLIKTCRYKDRI
jgi:hypothetical protein